MSAIDCYSMAVEGSVGCF